MSKARILIVEDEQIVALDIQNSLEGSGYDIAGQTDMGEDAVKLTGELQPDLILMDIGLKGEVDGIEAATRIRRQFDLPVIFLTAFTTPTILERARQAEPFGYVVKPFDERELIGNIEMAVYKHRMEKKLRESENKFRRVIEHASDGIAILDKGGHIIEWNPAIERITGLKRADVIDQPVWEAVFQITPQEHKSAEMREKNAVHWKAATENNFQNSDQLAEHEIETPQGIRRIIQSNGFTVETTQGLLGGVIMRDITQRKLIEIERGHLIAKLEEKNAELERFTYTVSHDLKAPLITIRGFLGYLEADVQAGNADRIKNDMGRINDAADKMQRLLGELLELSRIGRITNPPQRIPFETIVRDAVGLVAGRIAEKGVDVEIAPDLPIVCVDQVRFTQVMQNLIENAVKFMGEQPEPRIWIGERRDKEEVSFFVQDNGIGIAMEHHERIFGLFDKLDPKADGTGIGLALVKRIIETHGGKIWVESEGLGKGSTFCFTIPCTLQQAD
ncbi:MAG: response regulator [Anaerolineales bacterium]|nr:response regulator [Anaerolineales bacterium]